ncbi:MAG: hypothetical protein KDA51_08235 [Planctomycetales bacterium]|nr:hypothetical protein [Planctomycetales bacterium]
MRYSISMLLLFIGICSDPTGFAFGRTWSNTSGAYQFEAEVISFNDSMVVLKKPTGELVALELKDLSAEDQEYVRSQEAQDAERKAAGEMQTWTARDGMKVRGRVLAFGRKQLIVQRKFRTVFINDKQFSTLTPLHQKLVLRILSKLEDQQFETEKQLDQWTKKLGANPKSYPLEGVLLELESGDEIGVPFFLFSPEDLAVLEPGWELWKEREESNASREHESFLVRSAARAYQQDRRVNQQIEMLKLEMLGAATGVIAIWQVGLAPGPGVFGRPMSVMVPAQNSEIASQLALQRYPGSVLVGVRRASR